MRVIITGGTGFIGKPLIASLADDQHEVIVLSRNPESYQTDLPSGTRLVKWDAKSAQGWGHLADGADAIINMAGDNMAAGRWSEAKKQTIRSSRVLAGQAVTQAVEQASRKPKVVLQSSAVGYYGPSESQVISEKDPAGSDFQASVCQDWEASTAETESMGVRRVIFRTGLPLSPEGGILERFLLPFRFYAGGPLGSGKQYLPWIHISDQVGAIRFLMENPNASGAYNLSAPNPVTNKQFAQTLGKVLGKPSVIPVPGFSLRILFGEMADEMLLVGWRQVPERLLQAGYVFKFTELEPALRDLL